MSQVSQQGPPTRWHVLPIGFTLVAAQGASELIKRIGYLQGLVAASEFEKQAPSPAEEIAAIKAAKQIN